MGLEKIYREPFYSVVIPVYNKEPHISRSINSVLNQTFTDFEIIVVCDPSTDNSNAEVEKITDPRIRVFYRDEPGPGGYAARNLGIKEARAAWVAFLDADDEWYPEHLQKYAGLLTRFPDALALSCGWIEEYENNRKVESKYFRKNNSTGEHKVTLADYLRASIARRTSMWTSVVCLKRDVAEGIFPEGKANRGGDVYAWVMLLGKGNLAWSPHIGAIYFRDSVNMVTKTAAGSPYLAHKMVEDVSKFMTSKEDISLIKKFANRRIWCSYNSTGKQSQEISLGKNFYWRADPIYCFTRLLISRLPYTFLKKCLSFR